MDDALARTVDPTVLLPVVLLVVAEFSTLARDLDVRAAVAEERPPLVVDFVIHGVLTYLRVVRDILRRLVTPVVAPWATAAADLIDRESAWEGPTGPRPTVPANRDAVRTLFLPNLGQFGLLHLTNSGLVVFTFYATMTTDATPGLSFVQYLLAFVVVMLPLLEVGEYDTIQTAVDPVYSFASHLVVNVGIVGLVVPPTSVVGTGFDHAPLLAALAYVVWWLAAGYLYLVVLAVDIRRITDEE